MKKNILLCTALLSAAIVGSTPITSHAAEAGTAETRGNTCYKVYIGYRSKKLCQFLDRLGIPLDNVKLFCPNSGTPNVPEIPVPETPATEAPATECPGTEAPATETPATEAPATETPDTEAPIIETPGTDLPAPETPVPEAPAPDTPKPPVTNLPDTQKPEIDAPAESTHSYAEQVVKLVNEERTKAGLPALQMDVSITAAANVRAREIKQLFSHTRPNGSSFASVLQEQNISFRGAGENIAWGQKSPEQVMHGWMNSSGHRANILNKSFKKIGVGYYQDEKGVNHGVQLFTY